MWKIIDGYLDGTTVTDRAAGNGYKRLRVIEWLPKSPTLPVFRDRAGKHPCFLWYPRSSCGSPSANDGTFLAPSDSLHLKTNLVCDVLRTVGCPYKRYNRNDRWMCFFHRDCHNHPLMNGDVCGISRKSFLF